MYESYINKIEDVGKLRNLKPGTIRTYKNNVRDFLKFINKHPEDLTCEDARDFLLYLKDKGDKSSTLNNKNGSLVFFYKRVLGKLWDDNLVPRAINDYAIPRVLTREEVERLLDATPNLKYKLIQYRIVRNILTVIPLLCKHRFITKKWAIPQWNCPYILKIMRFLRLCTVSSTIWCKFGVFVYFQSFFTNEIHPVL